MHLWRRSFSTRPPLCTLDSPYHAQNDYKYGGDPYAMEVAGESLEDTMDRVLVYWNCEIKPSLLQGNTVLIVAHGNSLRALLKYLEGISDEDIPSLNVPLGKPLLFEFLFVESANSEGDLQLLPPSSPLSDGTEISNDITSKLKASFELLILSISLKSTASS